MSRLSRDILRRKLNRSLSMATDEATVALIGAHSVIQSGNPAPLAMMDDLPPEAVGAQIGTEFHIPIWTLETLVNELLANPKLPVNRAGPIRRLRTDKFAVLRLLSGQLNALENAEDGVFLEKYDVFTEVSRMAQRQFPLQRGFLNLPTLYRSLLLYGSGSAGSYFERSSGLSVSNFVKFGFCLAGALGGTETVDRRRDLSSLSITPEMREIAFAKVVIGHQAARQRAAEMRAPARHTAYKPSLLRNFPIIAFGQSHERLRAPIPDLIIHRLTSGLYLDVVGGGSDVWSDIGRRFEHYCVEYLRAMMTSYLVNAERTYGSKKSSYRTPDILLSQAGAIVAVVECKATRMTFDARFADDPMSEASRGFEEIAKGIFQIWRFFGHSRRGLFAETKVLPDCIGVIVTADSWLSLARKQAEEVFRRAHALSDNEGDILPCDRRDIAFCLIDDVEYTLQNGTPDTFLSACRAIATGDKKGWMLSITHGEQESTERPYPFRDKMGEVLPWWDETIFG